MPKKSKPKAKSPTSLPKSKGRKKMTKASHSPDDVLTAIEETLDSIKNGGSDVEEKGSEFFSKLSKHLEHFGTAQAQPATHGGHHAGAPQTIDKAKVAALESEANTLLQGGSQPQPGQPVQPGHRAVPQQSQPQPTLGGGGWGPIILQIIIAVLGQLKK